MMTMDQALTESQPHITAMANRFQRIYKLPDDAKEDLQKTGQVVVMENFHRYDESKGIPFWAFMRSAVHGRMLREINQWLYTFEISEHMNRQFTKISRIMQQHPEYTTNQLISESAKALKVSEKKATELIRLFARIQIVIDMPENELFDLPPQLVTEQAAAPDAAFLQTSDEKILEDLNRLIDRILKPRQAEMLRLHFGIGCEKHTYAQIAEEYCLTASAVQKTVSTALRIIRKAYGIHEKS